MATIKSTPKAYALAFTDKSVIDPFIETLLKSNFSPVSAFDWNALVENRTNDDSIEVIKRDDERRHLIYFNVHTHEVHKITALRKDLWDELQSLSKQQKLFSLVNKRTFTIQNNTHYVEAVMPSLGRPLHEQTEVHDTVEWQSIKNKAMKLVKSLHAQGYVHGDIRLENFLLNFNKELFLIDFETAKRLKPPRTGRKLTLFSSDLPLFGIDPQHYTFADDLNRVNDIFDSAHPQSTRIPQSSSMEQGFFTSPSNADCSTNRQAPPPPLSAAFGL